MTSPATKPPSREEESRLSVRTLVIASIASAAAAIITSQIWVRGTPIAAALTPVIVTLLSELLHRPTEAVARRMTTDRTAIMDPDAPVRELEEKPSAAEQPTAPVRVYRSAEQPRTRRRIHWKVVVVTGLLAFVIGAAVLTIPELIAGQSLGKGSGRTSIFSPDRDKDENGSERQQETTEEPAPEEEPDPEQTVPEEEPAPTEEPTPTTEEPTPTTTTPATPQVAPPAEP